MFNGRYERKDRQRGNDDHCVKGVAGKYGLGARNKRRERMLHFAIENRCKNVVICPVTSDKFRFSYCQILVHSLR